MDESHKSREILEVAALIVPQGRYSEMLDRLNLQSAKDRFKEIDAFLGKVGGMGVVCKAELKEKWLTEKANDSASDIRRLSRADNIWSWAVALTVMGAVVRLERKKGSAISTVDVYHDQKSLTIEHRQVLYEHLRTDIVQQLKRLDRKFVAPRLRKVSIRRVQEAPKAKTGEKPDKFQRGIWLADQVMRQAGKAENIELMDVTKHIGEIAKDWRKLNPEQA